MFYSLDPVPTIPIVRAPGPNRVLSPSTTDPRLGNTDGINQYGVSGADFTIGLGLAIRLKGCLLSLVSSWSTSHKL